MRTDDLVPADGIQVDDEHRARPAAYPSMWMSG
jgi:hypothetical protein